MKHTKSRILAIFLCLCMVVTLVPTVAFAAEGAVTLKVSSSASNDDATRAENAEYKTLNGALTKAQDGDTIILTGDVTYNTSAIAINKSVTIKSDSSKHTLTVKSLYISGTDKTVTLENLKITRAIGSQSMTSSPSGGGVFGNVCVGMNNSGTQDDTTPTVNIKNCEVSITGSLTVSGTAKFDVTPLRVGSGTVTVTGSTIKNEVNVTASANDAKVWADGILIDAKSDGGDVTRSVKITDSTVECTGTVNASSQDNASSIGVQHTKTVKKSELTVTGVTSSIKAKTTGMSMMGSNSTVTVKQGATVEAGKYVFMSGNESSNNTLNVNGATVKGWGVVSLLGNSLTANFTSATIESENKQNDGANNYAVFAFESGTGNKVTVSGGSISADGGASNSLSQYLASFYDGSNNSLEIKDSAEVTVENNKNDKWITYKQNPSTAGDYTPSNGNGTVKIDDDVTLQTGDGEDASFVVKAKDGNIVNVTEKFNSAVELVKDETSGVKGGSTIVVGKDATIEGGSAEVPAGLTVDVTKNETVAQQVKPATGVIVVYGITDGDKTEDKSFDSINNAPSSDVLNVKEAGFKAKAADAKAAIDAALAEEEKGPVSDVSDNTVYIILDHRVAGTSFKVKVDKDGGIYSESPAEGGTARVFYFTFPAEDASEPPYSSGSPAAKKIAAGEYTVKLYAGEREISSATKTFKIYEVKYVAGTGVTGTETTVYVDEAGLEAAKSATGSTMGFALSGSNNRWNSPAVEGSDYSFTVTYSGYYQSTGGGTVTPSTTVKTESAKNGSFTVSDKYASAGKTVKVTPKANEGYVVDQVTVTDKNGNNITVTQNADGTYSFVMPAKAAQPVTVKVTFKEEEQVHVCPSEKYTDVNTAAWYHEGVDFAIENKLMVSTGENIFSPNGITTRAQLVTILYRLEGEPAVTKDIPFADVPAGQWYSNAINWAAANGIVDGYGNGKFGPDDTITREQMAAILYRYASYKGYSVSDLANLTGYTDAASMNEWASTAMRWAVAEGLIEGTSATTLSPSGDSTRAQVATILMRFCEGVVK